MKRFLFLFILSFFLYPFVSLAEKGELPSGLVSNQVMKQVDKIMKKYVGDDIPGAAIVIVKDGKVILQKGYGFSDIKNGTKVDPEETVFEVGSISKLYTWTAVMQLVEQGKLDLDADIREYLPKNFLNFTYSEKLTLLDLMNHTGGFEEKTQNMFTQNIDDLMSLEDFLSQKISQPKQIYRPGTVMAYSNFGTSLAGFVVERVSGKSFADYMDQNILNKLEMKKSSFLSDYSNVSEIVNFKGGSYQKTNVGFEAQERFYLNGAPAGGLNTTVSDMGKFMVAQLDTEETPLFKNQNTLEKMHQPTYREHKNLPGNAHGFWERNVNQHRILEHSGSTMGYTSLLLLVPEESFGIALLLNVIGETSSLHFDLINELIGEQVYSKKISFSENDEQVEGTYRMARFKFTNFMKLQPLIGNGDVKVRKHSEGGITLQPAFESDPVRYTEIEDLLYERVDDTLTLTDKAGMDTNKVAFQLDEVGNVTKMTYGAMTDYLPVKVKDKVGMNIVVLLVSILTFILYSSWLLIRWLIRKQNRVRNTNSFVTMGLLASVGLIILINNTVLFIRFIPDFYQELAPFNIHLWINWLLPIAIIISGSFVIKQFKQTKLLINISRLYLLIISILFTAFLFNFHLLA